MLLSDFLIIPKNIESKKNVLVQNFITASCLVRFAAFFYWTTTDRLKITDGSQVNQKLCCRYTMIFGQRRRIGPPTC